MSPHELEYFRQRAQTERANSSEAQSQVAADVHLQLAVFYEALIEQDEALQSNVVHLFDKVLSSAQARLNSSRELLLQPVLGLPPG